MRQLESLFEGGSVAGLTDRQLLERFAADGRSPAGEAAFAAVIARHGPMVLNVCRQLIGDHHHAEDAFQAVFLVLAQKSRSIRDPELLGNWLYGVAIRTARCAKQQIARRRRREEGHTMSGPGAGLCVPAEATAPAADLAAIDREQAEAIHSAIDHLPRAFRLPVVLCYFEGLTLEQAAQRLRCPAGTVRSRLARAQEKLRIRLMHRGVVLPGAALAFVLAPRSASASIRPILCDSTTRAATAFAARHAAGGALSAPAAALAREVLRTMLLSKIKFTALSFLFLASVATGAGWAARSFATKDEPKLSVAAPVAKFAAREANPPPPIAKPDDAAPGRMFVTGRVLDPQGKTIPNAAVAVCGEPKYAVVPDTLPVRLGVLVLAQGHCDGSGRFQIETPRTSSSRYERVRATALAPGYGVAWVALDPDADEPRADVSLPAEQVIHGRVLDLHGSPVQDAPLRILNIVRSFGGEIEGLFIRGSFEKWPEAFPAPMVSNADGRFTLRGLGRAMFAILIVNDPRFAESEIDVETEGWVGDGPTPLGVTVFKAGGTSDSKLLTVALQPPRVVTGRVTDADTGKPMAEAHVAANFLRDFPVRTDADGRFRLNAPMTNRFQFTITPPEGQPYMGVNKLLDWPKGVVEQSIDAALPRGVVIHGKVTEAGSSAPVAGAEVRLLWHRTRTAIQDSLSVPSLTKPDGSFQVFTGPGRPGHLQVQGPSDDYVRQEIGSNVLNEGQPGGKRVYAHAFVPCDSKPGSEGQEINVVLKRGMTVKGRAVGVDGQPVQDAWMLSRIILNGRPTWLGDAHGRVHDGRFALHGLALDAEVPVYFLDPKGKRGATLNVSGKSSEGGSVTVRLEPCGAAKARLVDSTRKPLGQFQAPPSLAIMMDVTPGPTLLAPQQKTERLDADEDGLNRIDPINYPKPVVSDAQGWITLPVLIPGATYRFIDRSTFQDPIGPQIRKEFTVKPGETLDLGDVFIEKPRTQ